MIHKLIEVQVIIAYMTLRLRVLWSI